MLRFAALAVLVFVMLLIVAGFLELWTAALSSASGTWRRLLLGGGVVLAGLLGWALH